MNPLAEASIYTLVIALFTLGGDFSPLSVFKWYRSFMFYIGLKNLEEKKDV